MSAKTLEQYLEGKTGLEYYASLKPLTEAEMSKLWEEVDERSYMWFLEFYLPARQVGAAFATGEATCDGAEGTIHTLGVEFGGRFFLRPGAVEKFNPLRYFKEVRALMQVNEALTELESLK